MGLGFFHPSARTLHALKSALDELNPLFDASQRTEPSARRISPRWITDSQPTSSQISGTTCECVVTLEILALAQEEGEIEEWDRRAGGEEGEERVEEEEGRRGEREEGERMRGGRGGAGREGRGGERRGKRGGGGGRKGGGGGGRGEGRGEGGEGGEEEGGRGGGGGGGEGEGGGNDKWFSLAGNPGSTDASVRERLVQTRHLVLRLQLAP